MMKPIPEHWSSVSLREVGKFINGFAFKTSQWSSTGLPIIRIQNLNNPEKSYNLFDGTIDSRYRVRNGDVLISWSASLGTYKWTKGDAWLNQHIFKAVITDSRIEPDFFYWAAKFEIGHIARAAQGSTMKHVTRDVFLDSLIPLPPLAEQRAIADSLSRINNAIESRRRELVLESERKKSLRELLYLGRIPLLASGEERHDWAVTSIGAVAEFLQYGTSNRCDAERGTPVLAIPEVVKGKIDLRKVRFLQATADEANKLRLQDGDVLFVRTNATRENTGRCAVFSDRGRDILFASYLIRVRLKANTILPEFVREFTETTRGKAALAGKASHAADGKYNINTQTIRAVEIPIPPPDHQERIITVLQRSDRHKDCLVAEIRLLQELFNAAIADFMAGGVPIDRLLGEKTA